MIVIYFLIKKIKNLKIEKLLNKVEFFFLNLFDEF